MHIYDNWPGPYEGSLLNDVKLEDQDVHIWFMWYKDIYPRINNIAGIISNIEKKNSEKYKFINDRQNYIIRHGALRILIGSYLSIDPKDVTIGVSDYGKPYTEQTNDKKILNFNISHTKEIALYGFTLDRHIGVDIERIKPIQDINAIVDNYFSSDEKKEFNSYSADRFLRSFYHGWTQKEAFLKALGNGLSRGLDQFDVSMNPDEPATLKSTKWDPQEAGQWTLKTIQALSGYSVSVAVEGTGLSFLTLELSSGVWGSYFKEGSVDE